MNSDQFYAQKQPIRMAAIALVRELILTMNSSLFDEIHFDDFVDGIESILREIGPEDEFQHFGFDVGTDAQIVSFPQTMNN